MNRHVVDSVRLGESNTADRAVVPLNGPNKEEQYSVEVGEGRARTKENIARGNCPIISKLKHSEDAFQLSARTGRGWPQAVQLKLPNQRLLCTDLGACVAVEACGSISSRTTRKIEIQPVRPNRIAVGSTPAGSTSIAIDSNLTTRSVNDS
jgi:hypothetical protein